MKVVLDHVCNAKEYPGNPGDTVDVPEKLAESWILEGGAHLPPAEPAAAKKPVAKGEPAKQ